MYYILKTIEKNKHNPNLYIYDEKVNIHQIFVKYLAYLNNMLSNKDNDITDEAIKKLLSIKVCDYDWLFIWSDPIYDKDCEELLLQKIVESEITSIENIKK
jgi:hypothetical protein